jgi:hypothetical protein
MTEGTPRFSLLSAARLLDGTQGAPLEDAALLLDGERIARLGRRDDVHGLTGPPSSGWTTATRPSFPGWLTRTPTSSRRATARWATTSRRRTTISSSFRLPETRGRSSTRA